MSARSPDRAQVEVAAAWEALARRWDLTPGERRDLRPAERDLGGPPPIHLSVRVRILIEIGYRLGFDDVEELREWLRRPGAMLGHDSPLGMMSGPMAELLRLRGMIERGFGS